MKRWNRNIFQKIFGNLKYILGIFLKFDKNYENLDCLTKQTILARMDEWANYLDASNCNFEQ